MEVVAAVGLAGAVNSAVRAVTGKSIAQNCWSLINKARSKVLGTVVEVKAEQLAEAAWKRAEDAITGTERKERVAFSQLLAALGKTLRNLEANPVVEDDGVKGALDGLRGSLERAVEGTDDAAARGRAFADVQGYAQNLNIAMTAASAKRSDASAVAEMLSLDEIKAGVQQLLASEGAAKERFVYDPYDSDDSDQEASLLGEGSFGATHKMKNKDDGRVYAVKLMKIKKAGVPVEKLREEAVRLSRLNHPNIVRYFTAFRFKKDKFFAIAMEFLAGGSLLARIERERGPLTSGQRQRAAQTEQWARQVASALAYMHALRMQHRDLKPDNVLFDEHQNARVIDLGLAEVVVAKSKVSSAGGANAVGALLYQSPEKARGRSYDGKDDVWALGCMVAGAVVGQPLEERSGGGVFSLDPTAVKALVDETNAASAKFGGLVAAMLAKNPVVRPAAQDVEQALATGAPLVPGGAAIIEEDEEDEAIAAATEQRRAAEAKAAEERRQRLAAEAKTAEAERKLRAAEATAAEEKKQREAAAAAEAERRRRAAAEAKAAEEKKQREAAAAAEAERRRRAAAEAKAAEEKKQREAAAAAEAERRRRAAAEAKAAEEKKQREAEDVDLSKLVELRTLEGHSSSVNCVAISPDGRRIVSASDDKTLKVWDVATGECVATLKGHRNYVRCVAVFPDGRRVVSGSYDLDYKGEIKVWDVETGECVATLEGHSSSVRGVAVFPDGRRVVSGSNDTTLKVWGVATGECVATLEGHSSSVIGVAVFPDGRRVVSGSHDNTLKVWDVATGKCLATLEGHSQAVFCVAISPDGRRVVSGSRDHTLKVWDVATGRCVATLRGHSSTVTSVAISPDGRRVVSASGDKTLKVWDVATGECVATLEGHSSYVYGVAISPDGRRVVSGSDDKTLKLWGMQ